MGKSLYDIRTALLKNFCNSYSSRSVENQKQSCHPAISCACTLPIRELRSTKWRLSPRHNVTPDIANCLFRQLYTSTPSFRAAGPHKASFKYYHHMTSARLAWRKVIVVWQPWSAPPESQCAYRSAASP